MKGFINPQWAEALGLTLFDSLWQGAIVLIISFVVLLLMKKASPAKRYAVVLAAILILPLLSVTTFLGHLDNGVATSTLNSALDFESPSVFSLELNETSTPVEQAVVSPTVLAKWKALTSQNANLALVIWLMGAFLFTVRMLGGFYFLNRLKSGASLITDAVWLEKMSTLCESLKIKGKVLLKQSERVSSPLVMGVIKPVIIFPMGLIQALPTDEIEAILVHELAHIKRKDFLINIVINLLQVVYFFHPAFWWLKTQLDAEREFHCDDIALNQLGKKLTLIKALTNASEYQGHKFQPALAFAGKKNQLLSRVKRIVDHKPQMNWLGGFMSLGILVLSFVLMSQNASQEDKPTMADLEEDNIENLMQMPAPQDTTKVRKAILELLKQDSKVTVKTDASGTVTMFLNDKTEITGEEFEAYKAAYEQIHKFSNENQRTQEELRELAEMVNVKNRKIEVALRRAQLEELMIERAKLENSAQTETEAERAAKTQADQEIVRAQKALREVEEVIKVSEVEKAEVSQQEIIEWVKKEKEIQEQEEVNIARIRAETRKVEREIPQIQVELKELEKQMKASGKTDTAIVNQYKKQLDELREHWRTLNSYSSNLSKYEKEVNQYLEEMNSSINFSAPKIRYQYMGKILGEEEMSQYKLVGLRVSEIIEDYPVYDEKEHKEIKVKLIKLSKGTVQEAQDTSTVRYMVDGKLRESGIISTLDPNQVENISVIKGQTAVLKQYPDIPTPVSGLIIIETKNGYEKATSGITMRSPLSIRVLDFSTVNFDDKTDNSQRTNFTIKRLKEDNAILEIDGELKPDMTDDQIKALDLMNVKSIQIIKNDKMFDYHKKRKLKGYDALIRIVTK
ncbi:M56 family metallopeptidase [Roseivirga echinicomitans]|uniref:Peptidase M56 domain-containing protein n=1 Tax=Roseivirga echinicomitans TaxID=296218 RepID=A0A150XYJ0_9BACT|nr:M56 family metallopeptidase [Roseivirga echinicomitans]KYG83771.1 hypothetical protein AWN68_02905 [Roseivirga echinicomitans]